jgi:hypothetical protein
LGLIRLFCIPFPEAFRNFWDVPNLLLQKFPAPQFTATAKVAFTARTDGERTGLIVMGTDYAYLSVTKKPEGLVVSQTICRNADRGAAEKESAPAGGLAPKWACSRFAPVPPPRTVMPTSTGSVSSKTDSPPATIPDSSPLRCAGR